MTVMLIFTEGTILKHKGIIEDYNSYIPVGNAVGKIKIWKDQGAEIYYLTSRREKQEIEDIREVLKKYNFPDFHNLYFRKEGEEYHEVAEKLLPNVIVEDDCASIGGEGEMVYPHIREDIKSKIKSIVVREFCGIDHLPDKI
ncbi:MAG: hypothetical protein UT63_C0035G0010 [Candidatus Gottesmanbacteria bacterium GW2011_GWC2_39_8]|uniref:Uncharacterized protein n=1 Tax=Candidatus Gottesmanbacteria bacterium GW2011_GWC2_39_8 TaxID=1618450 RepID=A0A0G0T4G8_9BACT|nr:MAG: hypothetical protein UT63_C0035G0010 [Candidatus Gottesmanbacteria bacterium GW2011_GWC2_39_8]